MLSLRILSRSAPRIATRSITTAARHSSVLPVQRQLAIASRITYPSIKSFSTTNSRFDAQAQELAAKLENELQLETDNTDGGASQSEESVKRFLDSQQWELVDNEGEQVVKLQRKYEDESIEVSFSIADFPPAYEGEDDLDDALLDEEDMEAQSGGANTKGAVSQGRTSGGNVKVASEDRGAPGDREELRDAEDEFEGGQQPFPVSFAVTIQRPGKTGALRVDLIAEDGDYSIQSIAHLNDAKAVDSAIPGIPIGAEKFYAGPPFQQLDEELQNFFVNYLEERGIDSGLALFIPDYIDVKEQKEYLAWLKRVREFVD